MAKNKNEKLSFWLNLLLFVALLAVSDLGLGRLLQHLFFTQTSGKFHRITESVMETTAEVLVMGSSHANRHYVPQVFSDTLGMSCYNAGVQGQGILFTNAMQRLILARYTPKVMILNLDPRMICESAEAYDRLADLLPYYHLAPNELAPFVRLKSRFEPVKLLSRLYPYNSKIIHIAKYWLSPQVDFNGYRPLHGELQTQPARSAAHAARFADASAEEKIDQNFVDALQDFVATARKANIELFCVISPHYGGAGIDRSSMQPIVRDILAKHHIAVLDHSNDEAIIGNPILFFDQSHLNANGALIFSKTVASEIRNLLLTKRSPARQIAARTNASVQ